MIKGALEETQEWPECKVKCMPQKVVTKTKDHPGNNVARQCRNITRKSRNKYNECRQGCDTAKYNVLAATIWNTGNMRQTC